MPARILPAARARLVEIWEYTAEEWGEAQADTYVRGLVVAIHRAQKRPASWRHVKDDTVKGAYFVRYRRHYISSENFPKTRWA